MESNYVLQRTPGTSYVSAYLRGPAPLNTALGPMDESVEFRHRWWHVAGLWAAVLLSFALGSVTTRAALFAQPHDKRQWIPLTLLILVSWMSFAHHLRLRRTPSNSFQATS